jgi:hypothetical protein
MLLLLQDEFGTKTDGAANPRPGVRADCRSDTTLNQAREKADADLKASEAVTEKDQAAPARDKFLGLTEPQREAVIECLNIEKKQSVRFKPSPDPTRLALDHSHAPIPDPVLMKAFGSADATFIDGIVAQLASAVPDGFGPDFRALNFAVSVINDIAPRSQLQTMLAAQMFAVHNAIMKYARHVEPAGGWVDEDLAARTLSKLSHTFVSQLEALHRLRTAEEKVAQHVFIAAGGQSNTGKAMQAASEEITERKAAAGSVGTNVVHIPTADEHTQNSKGRFRRRPTK